MARLGIIGSGAIGSTFARIAVAAGDEVLIANSRGPESLADLVAKLGDAAQAGTLAEAAQFGDFTALAVPMSAHASLPSDVFAGRTVLSACNYVPSRDGRIAELDSLEFTTGEYEAKLFSGAEIVKSFSNIMFHHITSLARPAGASDRSGMALFGDSKDAKALVSSFIDRVGFDPLDGGALSEAWRIEPASGAYAETYAAEPETMYENYLTTPALAVSKAKLQELVDAAQRLPIDQRGF